MNIIKSTHWAILTIIVSMLSLKLISQQPIKLTNPKKDWTVFYKQLKEFCSIDTFIETGTYLGDTTAKAAECFSTVHTIELCNELYMKVVERFKNNSNILLYYGDSAEIFPQLLPKLSQQKKATIFWLDGHYVTEGTALGSDYTPIEKELSAIIDNELRECIILIDDVRLFGTILNKQRISLAGRPEYPLLASICNQLKKADFKYQILGDILIAHNKSIPLSFSPLVQACTISRLFDETNYTEQELFEAEKLIRQTHDDESEAVYELYVDFSMPWRGWYNKSPHYNLWYGLTLMGKAEYEKASQQFQEVIRLGYDHWRIYWYLAESSYYAKEYAQAESALKAVLSKHKNFIPAEQLLQLLP